MQGEQPVWKEAWHGIRQCVRAPQRTATGRRVSGDSGTRPGRRYRQQCRRFRQCRELGPFPSLVALVKRVRQPFLGCWALPGGDLRSDRSLEQSAYAALESTTDLHPRYLEQLYTFGGPTRSHGGLPMVSVVYWALVGQTEAAGFEDGDNVRWFPEDELPELAFDHRQIIDYALLRLRSKIEYSDVATRLLGPTFTLRQLHGVYEAIGGEPLDLANFRRKMLASGDLEDTGEKMREGRQRPATVYRYIPKRPVENGTPHESDGDDIMELSRQGEREDALDALIPSARI